MEPPKKRKKLARQLNNVYIPCVSVEEMLPDLVQRAGCHLKLSNKKAKRTSQAATEWFYNEIPVISSFVGCRHPQCAKPENCKNMLVKAHQLKAKQKKSLAFFDVEYIADFKVVNGKRWYLVKWAGWPKEANTWEKVSSLNCSKLISDFHADYVNQLSKFLEDRKLSWPELLKSQSKSRNLMQRLYAMAPNNFHFEATYTAAKKEQQLQLLKWQTKINTVTRGFPLVAIENEVDLEVLPSDFEYVEQNIPGPGIKIPNDPLIGCECVGSCSIPLTNGTCCPSIHKEKPAYQHGLLTLKPGKPIFECNSRCQCGFKCPNRVVQKGPQLALSLFRTSNGKGWGVKALEPISKGAFVMEYVGEVITNDEAERRGKVYDDAGITYLFDLDFNESENPLTVDATNYGNISHFVNHSCCPNLQVYNVFIDNMDPSFPRIALFARRNISINEELTFDYQMTGDMTDGKTNGETPVDLPGSLDNHEDETSLLTPPDDDEVSDISRTSSASIRRIKCLCGSSNCREWLI